VDFIVESSKNPPPVLIESKDEPNEADRKIADILMGELQDGCCLQFGIGALPNLVGKLLAEADVKDLGMHSEMLVEASVDLFEAGILNGSRKTIDKGRMAYTFCVGSQRLYDFVENNPAVAVYPSDYTNDPFIIAQNDKVFAINNCLAVDLQGQISSESVGPLQISGTGGSIDFMMGSFRSKGGKGFQCLNSTRTNKDGMVASRIVPGFEPGTIVTIPRPMTFYVVTEYGIVNLKGLANWQRAEAVISIAHPDFRDDLIKAAEKNKVWRKTNKIS
jgi:acyl-CoA hydrolase